jgi:glycosyltransferase involved in cell wall biosynthesis
MSQITRPRTVAIVLAYNVARMLPRAIARIPKHLVDDIIIANDGSSDETIDVARRLGVRCVTNEKNLGYGGNLKKVMALAFAEGAEYVVEVHGDGAQFDPSAIQAALPYMRQGYDLILGSRFVRPQRALENGMPLVRFLANRALSFFDRLALRLPLTEFHTGFRIYGRRLYESVPFEGTSDDYLYSFQVIAQSAYYGLAVAEVEVEADYRSEHTSHKLSGAAVYAVKTFGVLADYLRAKAGVRYTALFRRPEGRTSLAEFQRKQGSYSSVTEGVEQ